MVVLRLALITLVALVIAGCGTAPEAAVPTAAPIQPTAVPTAVPLADLDLEPLLIQAGDLPAGLTGAQIRDTAPEMFSKVPKATKTLNQQFAQADKQVGGVTVLLYDSPADVSTAYDVIWNGMSTGSSALDIGEKAGGFAKKQIVGTTQFEFSDVLFRRCHAVVHIRMPVSDIAMSTAYAQRLDKRLSAVVCR
jgi:hypothetical protein